MCRPPGKTPPFLPFLIKNSLVYNADKEYYSLAVLRTPTPTSSRGTVTELTLPSNNSFFNYFVFIGVPGKLPLMKNKKS